MMDNNKEYHGIWVFVELEGGRIRSCSLELLSLGRNLSDELGDKLTALLIGNCLGALPEEVIHYGADFVFVIESPTLTRYTTDPYYRIICSLSRQYKPQIMLFSSTDTGMDLAPRVACELETGLCAHCVGLKVNAETRELLQICPYSEYMATLVTHGRPQMATVQAGISPRASKDDSRTGSILRLDLKTEPGNVRIIGVTKIVEEDTEKIEEADVIIAVGRGVRDLGIIEKLAKSLRGVLGATQPIVDAGLLPESRMIGQTGKTVQPKLYIACGVSGAGHHVIGMQKSGLVVAINTDEKAAIFRVADYGIIGDISVVIPELLNALNR